MYVGKKYRYIGVDKADELENRMYNGSVTLQERLDKIFFNKLVKMINRASSGMRR